MTSGLCTCSGSFSQVKVAVAEEPSSDHVAEGRALVGARVGGAAAVVAGGRLGAVLGAGCVVVGDVAREAVAGRGHGLVLGLAARRAGAGLEPVLGARCGLCHAPGAPCMVSCGDGSALRYHVAADGADRVARVALLGAGGVLLARGLGLMRGGVQPGAAAVLAGVPVPALVARPCGGGIVDVRDCEGRGVAYDTACTVAHDTTVLSAVHVHCGFPCGIGGVDFACNIRPTGTIHILLPLIGQRLVAGGVHGKGGGFALDHRFICGLGDDGAQVAQHHIPGGVQTNAPSVTVGGEVVCRVFARHIVAPPADEAAGDIFCVNANMRAFAQRPGDVDCLPS